MPTPPPALNAASLGPASLGIVIPAHDAAAWIGDALDSLARQSWAEWRATVVDDGSTDATAALVVARGDPRVTLLRQNRAGVSAARNRGAAALAGAAALLFLDADDWLAPDALARLRAALAAAPDAVAAVGKFVHVDPAGTRERPHAARGGDLLVRLLTRNLFANGGHVLIRAEAAARAGGFNPDLTFAEDWEYWVRLAALGPFAAAAGPPVLFVRRRAAGAYLGRAADPAAFAPALAAAYAAPALIGRFGPRRLARLRRRMAAENLWVAGRALLWHGRRAEALALLRRAWRARPGPKRAAALALWHLTGGR